MQVRDISACITTDRLEESRAFYAKHLGARVTFDCGWYINLEFGERGACLQFMKPQHGEALCNPAGLTYNLHVEDVDMECARMLASGIEPIMPITDHPWGDRAFTIQDRTASCSTSTPSVNRVPNTRRFIRAGKPPVLPSGRTRLARRVRTGCHESRKPSKGRRALRGAGRMPMPWNDRFMRLAARC